MIKGFSVSNFKSINDEQTISFSATKIVRHDDHVVHINDKKILRSGLVFGANAGGKSNLIQAIYFSRKIILGGLDQVNLIKKNFRINNLSYKTPGTFEYNLIANGNEYTYGIAISYNKREIIGEWLIKNMKPRKDFVIFKRVVNEEGLSTIASDVTKHSHLNSLRLQVYFEDFGEDISADLRKKTMLQDIATRNNKEDGIFGEISKVYNWFKKIIIIFPDSKYNMINEIASDKHRRDFFLNILKYFDTGIEDITSQKRSMDFDKILSDLPTDDVEKIKIQLSKEATEHPVSLRIGDQAILLRKDSDGNIIYNKLLLSHGNPSDPFEYNDESDGTKRLFDLIPLLSDRHSSNIIIIDEIDRSLHTNLVCEFIKQFYKMTNKKTQLIATTHDTNVLDLDLLRQDEIWFVERQKNHSSKIYPLIIFKERFDKIIKNSYLEGKYQAVPRFNPTFLDKINSSLN